ncbi:MAG: hypothetical protein H7329_14790 [Opitutaceae bacterium]|nr:hypothetical protein [Cytophagales bacterium]
MKQTQYIIFILTIFAITLSGCKKNKASDPTPEQPVNPGAGDEENITRIQLQFIDSADATLSKTFSLIDPDGQGKKPPVADTIKLSVSKTYLVKLTIYDDTKTPAAIVSDEVRNEGNFHRFHYSFKGSAVVFASITDYDSRIPAQPLGLQFKLKLGNQAGYGLFNINLRHFSNGIEKTGNPTDGEQDILIDFPMMAN